MRGIAILLVVGFHAGVPSLQGGFVGVDVFFVISGYLITGILLEELVRHSTLDLFNFYARRVRRLLPALVVVLLACFFLGAFLLTGINQERRDLLSSARATLLLAANFYFLRQEHGYFDPSPDQPTLLHAWSLSVEEQFYLVWPILMLTTYRLAPKGLRRLSVGAVLLLIGAASFIGGVQVMNHNPQLAFYGAPFRAWELAVGGLLAIMWRMPSAKPKILGRAGQWIGIAALFITLLKVGPGSPWPGLQAALPILGTAALIWGCASAPDSRISGILSSRPLVYTGLISYSWYLWHWPLLIMARSYSLGVKDAGRDTLAILVSLGFAAASYRWVEQPIRRGRRVVSIPARRTVLAGIFVSALVVGVSFALDGFGYGGGIVARERLLAVAAKDRSAHVDRCQLAWNSPVILPGFEDCAMPKGPGPVNTILWGDSHAMQWLPLLEKNAAQEGSRVYALTRDACPPLIGLVPKSPASWGASHSQKCKEFNDAVARRITELRSTSGDFGVVLGARWINYEHSLSVNDLSPDEKDANSATALQADPDYIIGLKNTLAFLDTINVRSIVVGPMPSMPYDVPECLLRLPADKCGSSGEDLRRVVHTPVKEIYRLLTEAPFADTLLWNPSEYLCAPDYCPPDREGLPLYQDSNHVTASTALSLLEASRPTLRQLKNSPLQ